MMASPPTELTALLARWRSGDRSAERELFDAIYPVLRGIAQARLRRLSTDLTLSATEIVNETYERLLGSRRIEYRDRTHFFAMAARAIRHFVIDQLRTRGRDKRGGGQPFVRLSELDQAEPAGGDSIDLRVDWLAVHAAIEALEQVDAGCSRLVELKFFSGLTVEEIAESCGVSRATVVRDWRFAKAWLAQHLQALN
ncbi:ECF-type sigma factor [Tahibacter harae]|uniref:ECF-type sigma factor n=1 Tax=Tahibacter harae TaxID=2963937 RepID=A0ABT1QLL2_9GAMM|nr:ECF-type sigma factor [Tahibacter harae]MCQ4163347.1 ECF-type sigma factor [Tahibacter harae]